MQIDLYAMRCEVQKEILNTVAELLAAKCRGADICPCVKFVDCPIGNIECHHIEAEDWIQYFESRGD